MAPIREQLHVPGKGLWPAGLVVGLAALLAGLALSWEAAAAGAVLTVACALAWIRGLGTRGALIDVPAVVVPETRATRAGAASDPLVLAAHDGSAPMSRSIFLELSTLGLGGVIGGLVTLPVLGFMIAPAFLNQGVPPHDLGPMDDYPSGEYVVTSFTSNPAQGPVSRRTAFVRNNGLLGDLPSFSILSSRCVHLGCPVQPNGELQSANEKTYKDVTMIPVQASGFGCPCHDSQYDDEGNRTAGPAPRALDRYSYSIINGHVFVGATYSVAFVVGTGANAQIHEEGYAFPGEHVNGIESWLYPVQPPH